MAATMDIEAFWEHIFSDDRDSVLRAWRGIDAEERASVHELLVRIQSDPERIDAQRTAAAFATRCIYDAAVGEDTLPAGALEFARSLARDVGRLLHKNFGLNLASVKRDGTLVTESDLESDRLIHDAILARYPDHRVLSEERQKVYDGAEWSWLIDPIDGTTNFSHGFPCWGVLIALLYHGQPVLGVSEFPALSKQFYALRGSGAFLNDQPIRAAESAPAVFEATQIIATCSRTVENGPVTLPGKVRVSGSSGYDLALLASGVAALSIQSRVYPWDVAAGWVLSQEAGAIIEGMPDGDVFPLRRGTDCGHLRFAVVGGASVQLVNIAKKAITTRFVAA
jgi:myo-inositol-1(or 4)-monophosphatase